MKTAIVVVGTGRSGTSFTARLLHERLGVCMGLDFVPVDDTNPDGFYEDRPLVENNNLFLNDRIPLEEWGHRTTKYLAARAEDHDLFGVKDPRIVHLFYAFRACFPVGTKVRLIVCTRDRGSVLESLMRCYDWSERQAEFLHDKRTQLTEQLLHNYPHALVLDYTNRRSEDDVVAEIRAWMWEV